MFEFTYENNLISFTLKDDAVITSKLTLQFVLTASDQNDNVLDATVIVVEIEQDEYKPYPKIFEKYVYLGSASETGLEMNTLTLLTGIAMDIEFDVQDCK